MGVQSLSLYNFAINHAGSIAQASLCNKTWNNENNRIHIHIITCYSRVQQHDGNQSTSALRRSLKPRLILHKYK